MRIHTQFQNMYWHTVVSIHTFARTLQEQCKNIHTQNRPTTDRLLNLLNRYMCVNVHII